MEPAGTPAGTVIGESVRVIGSGVGRRHSSPCDISHGLLWQPSVCPAQRTGLRAPVDTFLRTGHTPYRTGSLGTPKYSW